MSNVVQAHSVDLETVSSADFEERATRSVVWALVCFGFLAGPLAAVLLITVPFGILALGTSISDPVVQVVGTILFCVHGVAIISLFRVRERSERRRDLVSVSKTDVPELFHLIEALAKRTDAPAVDLVLFGTDMNASLAQKPVWFGFGGHRAELTIGLPLLVALDDGEFSAVLAHELAHARRGDGALHAALSRVRKQWRRMETACDDSTFAGRATLLWFTRWYLLLLDHYAADVLHVGEFAADAVAARATSPLLVARALLRTHAASEHLESLWSDYWLSNVILAKPLRGPWHTFASKLHECRPVADHVFFRHAVSGSDGATSAHPALCARLSRVGHGTIGGCGSSEHTFPPATARLGPVLAKLISHFDAVWWRAHSERWTTFHATVPEQRARLDFLDRGAAYCQLSAETAIERANRAEYLVGSDGALARYHWAVRHFPTSPDTYRSLGHFMLRIGDQAGASFLEHAAKLDAETSPQSNS